MSPRLATTRLVKIPGGHRWKAVPAYRRRTCTAGEIARLFHELEHDLARSADPASDLWTRYQAQSSASLALATVVLRAWGYEAVPPLDPENTFGALPELFGPEGRETAAAFLVHHRKSRRRKYWATRIDQLERELGDLAREVDRFKKSVLEWLEVTRRSLLRPRPNLRGTEDSQMTLF